MSATPEISWEEPHIYPRLEPPHPPEDAVAEQPASDFVCAVCDAVKWARAANLKNIYPGQRHPWRVVIPSLDSTSAELSASPCKVCRILSVIKTPAYDGHQCLLYAYIDWYGYAQLRVVSKQIHGLETRYLHMLSDQEVFPCLTVIGTNDDRDLKGMKVQPLIDSKVYDDAKDFMMNCVHSHGQTCRPMSNCSRIPGFKVIEVSSGTVIEASDQCEYLALSYVWGSTQHPECLEAAPSVIKDTLTVAEKLGLKYVWIDRYCITREGPEKQKMLSRMGEIYSNAYCTVIAAAGEDAQTGLPGVSETPRQPQREVNVKGFTLVELPYSKDHGSALLSSSKWATRGWTYQEGYLSTRRLIFTKHRLLYLCNREFAPEPFKRQELASGEAAWAKKYAFARFVPINAFGGHRASAANLREQIQEYTRRDLTHSEDSLNAFLGVLDYNSRTARPIAHIWGLPLYEDQAAAPQPRDILFELFWWHETPGTRRDRFPSWTWVGWAGSVRFRTNNKVRMFPEGLRLQPPEHSQITEISFMKDEGQTLYQYAEDILKRKKTGDLHEPQPGPRILLVSCYVLPLRMQHFHLNQDQIDNDYIMTAQHTSSAVIGKWSRRPDFPAGGPLAVVQVCGGVYMCIRPWLDQEVGQWDHCFALHFAANKATTPGLFTRERNLLVVRRIRHQAYERIGLIHWHFLDFDQSIFFIDEENDFMEKVTLPPEDELFCAGIEKQTICLA